MHCRAQAAQQCGAPPNHPAPGQPFPQYAAAPAAQAGGMPIVVGSPSGPSAPPPAVLIAVPAPAPAGSPNQVQHSHTRGSFLPHAAVHLLFRCSYLIAL